MPGNLSIVAAAIAVGLCVIGTAIGIGRICAAALEGTARQPGASGEIRAAMLVGASMMEGAGLFGLLICLLIAAVFH